MTKKYKSEHAETVHKTAEDFFEIGLITKERMKEYDDMCLVKEEKQTHKQMRRARVSVGQTQLEQTA